MAALEAKTVHVVAVSGVYRVEASDSQDAFAKAREYYEDNISELEMTDTTETVYVEVEED